MIEELTKRIDALEREIKKVDNENLIRVGRFRDSCIEMIKNTVCYDCRETNNTETLTTDTDRFNFIQANKATLSCINDSWIFSSNSTKTFIGSSARQVVDKAIRGE